MEYLFIYALQVVEKFENVIILLTVLGSILLFLMPFIKTVSSCEGEEFINFANYKAGIIVLIIAFILSLMPTKQTVLLAAGTYYGKQLVQTEKVQKISNIIDLQLDKLINDLKEEVTNEKHR